MRWHGVMGLGSGRGWARHGLMTVGVVSATTQLYCDEWEFPPVGTVLLFPGYGWLGRTVTDRALRTVSRPGEYPSSVI